MENLYLFFVVVLFTLAITDLIVGVSNDAVNFLNSAIGSKVAPKKIIFLVASIGIFVGATFSSGMMEIARKGIFNPEFFFFSDIMVIFLAVMIADIIILDLFNTLGMPTSTTVSIVFELLGAAVIVSILKLVQSGENIALLGDYINTDKALAIISGILLSVVVAFSVGALVQYISRVLFSFNYHARLKYIGSIWVGFALTGLSYFLLVKGLKGASFVSDSFLSWVKENTFLLIGGSFLFWTVTMQLIATFTRWNILKFVVLFGTFALAMAFAGNDLVNFIGVPIAGFESFMRWKTTNLAPNEFNMAFLKEPVRTDTYLLVIAGVIMIITLLFSKKAQTVTETEVNLGRQAEGAERFSPNAASRFLVTLSIQTGNVVNRVVPARLKQLINSNFTPALKKENDAPAFDLIRASVNLTMASVLISFATSLKLPLSTTYVSFMVAMGTSLADRAWDRESAVYRISGVLSVIGGWFITAFVAFSIAAIFALLIFKFELPAVIALVILAFVAILRNFFSHKKKSQTRNKAKLFPIHKNLSQAEMFAEQQQLLIHTYQKLNEGYKRALDGLISGKKNLLRRSEIELKELKKDYINLRLSSYSIIQNTELKNETKGEIIIDLFDAMQDVTQSLEFISSESRNHVLNSHKNLLDNQVMTLRILKELMHDYYTLLENAIRNPKGNLVSTDELRAKIHKFKLDHINRIKEQEISPKNHNLYLYILLETDDLIVDSHRMFKLLNQFKEE